MTTERKTQIECEQITIELQKPVMAFLRFQAGRKDVDLKVLIQNKLLRNVMADVEDFNGEDLAAMLGLDRIFYEILDDKRYKPKEAKAEAGKTPTENEQVLIDVPKIVMGFLRTHEKDLGRSVKEYLELAILQTVDGDFESFDAEVKQLLTNMLQSQEA
jgi:hypothetical protein